MITNHFHRERHQQYENCDQKNQHLDCQQKQLRSTIDDDDTIRLDNFRLVLAFGHWSRQNPGANKTMIGKISKRPNIISQMNMPLDAKLKQE